MGWGGRGVIEEDVQRNKADRMGGEGGEGKGGDDDKGRGEIPLFLNIMIHVR